MLEFVHVCVECISENENETKKNTIQIGANLVNSVYVVWTRANIIPFVRETTHTKKKVTSKVEENTPRGWIVEAQGMCWKNVFTMSFSSFRFSFLACSFSRAWCVACLAKSHYEARYCCVLICFCASHDFSSFFGTILLLHAKKSKYNIRNSNNKRQYEQQQHKTESINNLRSAYSPCDVVDIVRYLWPLAV